MKRKVEFKEIDQARKTLKLGENAVLKEIKDAYRSLAARYHPDRCRGRRIRQCEKKMREINHAKDLLLAYCGNYRFSFKEKDVLCNSFDKEEYDYISQFYDGWVTEL